MDLNIPKSKEFKSRADEAFNELHVHLDIINKEEDVRALKRHWSGFLSEYRKVLKFLEQAARNLNENNWADALKTEQKQNEVFAYLFHARNVDEHGATSGYVGNPAALTVGNMFSFAGDCRNITITNCDEITTMPDGSTIERRVDGNFSVSNGVISEGSINSQVPIKTQKAFLRLNDIIDRGVPYKVPKKFHGNTQQAFELAKNAKLWLDKKIRELNGFYDKL